MSIDFKVVLLGRSNVGKTCLITRYISNKYSEGPNTIGAAFNAKRLEVKGKPFVLGIWDTAGSEKYESVCKTYYRNAGAAIICYDITSLESFKKVEFWLKEIRENEPDSKIILCGNKLDCVNDPSSGKEREVDLDYVKEFALANNIDVNNVFETSARNGINVSRVFERAALMYDPSDKTNDTKGNIQVNENQNSNTGNCC